MSDRIYKKLRIEKGVTAVIGSGGKTTLIRRVASELKEDGFSVIVTTSTKIFIPGYCPLVCDPFENKERFKALMISEGIAAIGKPVPTEGGWVKLEKPEAAFEELAALADCVLVEADGSKHLPLKAHADHEPVIPDCAGRTVQVVGLWGVGQKVSEAVHRPEIFAKLSGLRPEEAVTEESVARVINAENLCDILYFTGTDEVNRRSGEKLAGLVRVPAVMEGQLWISDR